VTAYWFVTMVFLSPLFAVLEEGGKEEEEEEVRERV